ncbi:uncharacterized protein LOC131957884 isoform X2 [Physella acuta]|uniref:uncharacterized protein LOC131957884 isoform X2 n=1 Tax=Physella acuta TaxID=109671 RepID=UPI0027DE17A1|nr:uncharacterized protein LOC131957884 isoform X2 [Physella acuta]
MILPVFAVCLPKNKQHRKMLACDLLLAVIAFSSLIPAVASSHQDIQKQFAVDVMKILRENIVSPVVSGEQNIEHDVKVEIEKLNVFNGAEFGDACSCLNYTCGCCLHLEAEKISLNNTGCINITYLPDEYGFEFTFSLDGKILVDRKISVKNPPPICAAIPYVHNLASLCIRFYNLDYKDSKFYGCTAIEAELEGIVVKTFDLGCFQIPPGKKISVH